MKVEVIEEEERLRKQNLEEATESTRQQKHKISELSSDTIPDEIEEAKKWLFFGNVDPKERASLDANFCKVLLLLYLKDRDININFNNIPDINFLLEILFNDINTDKILLERLMVTLKGLNFEVKKGLWRSFLFKEKK